MSEYQKAKESAEYIKSKVAEIPEVAVVLGSGIGALADEAESATIVDYKDIPNYPGTSVLGHKGSLVFGKLRRSGVNANAGLRDNVTGSGVSINAGLSVNSNAEASASGGKEASVILAAGRAHLYEGHKPSDVVFYIKVFKLLGVRNIILTNAAGGVNTGFSAGDIMLIQDHIGLFAPSALAGENEEEFGVRFPDMSQVYDKGLMEIARSSATMESIKLRTGVYAYAKGPMFETPAEIAALRMMGADAVGMSTVPEAVTANYCGIKALGLSLITNMAAGVLDQPLTHDEVMEMGKIAGEKLVRLIKSIIFQI
ncbi:MAG: purine-nucleoside phosphorylase [Oscillospiraceae bacterium]|nr:purine-nucleoside phosphorylase [Oscillospiraceae bacterium]